MATVVVNVANGEVIDAIPVPDAFTTIESNSGVTVLIPAPSFDTTYVTNNRVDTAISSEGDVVSSEMSGRTFDLYVQFAQNSEVVQVTHDNCIERYPRWRPR